MLKQPSTDPRSQKSLNAISDALVVLLRQKDFHQISAQQLIHQASVSLILFINTSAANTIWSSSLPKRLKPIIAK